MLIRSPQGEGTSEKQYYQLFPSPIRRGIKGEVLMLNNKILTILQNSLIMLQCLKDNKETKNERKI